MKKILSLIILSFAYNLTIAQVGVNNTNPQAQLDISATSVTSPSNEDGILIPRIDNFPTTNPTATQDGMMVFATGNGTPTKGFYYWDNGTTSWVGIGSSSSSDNDWYIAGSTNIPSAITDDILTQGSVTVGNSITGGSAKLNINSNDTNPTTVRVDNSGTIVTENIAIQLTNNSLNGTTSDRFISVESNLTSNDGFSQTGFLADFDNMAASSYNYGLTNEFQAGGTNGYQRGVRNYFGGGQGAFGLENVYPGAFTYSGITYGVYNSLQSQGNGTKYGVYNNISGTGSGVKYGTFSRIISTSGGTHYGIYSDVQSTTGYSAYLLGRTSLGETTSNRYLMPAVDGTAGQVMTTDGSGNISFTTPSTGGSLDQAYDFGGAGVGRTIIADAEAVRIDGEDGFLVTGTIGNGSSIDTEITGAGTRMFFNPNKAAFRSGSVDGSQWDNSNIGENSTAFGFSTIASGDYSFSLGYNTAASGLYSLASGNNSLASADYSEAHGENTIASGLTSIAFGSNTSASGDVSTTFGALTNASGNYSTATGYQTTAFGSYSISMGFGTLAQGDYSTAFGLNTSASNYSIAGGENSSASANHSLAIGESTTASGSSSVALGSNTTAIGGASTAFGGLTSAVGDYSTALGYETYANGNNSTALGHGTTAYSAYETVIGRYNSSYTPTSTSTWNSNDKLFVVGNGVSSSTPNDALTIFKDGRLNINQSYTMPLSDGTSGQVMTTDGSGNISFTTPSTGGTLDQAYDFGGAGVGRTIIADNGAVDIQDAGGLRVEGDISAAENIVHDGDTDTFLTFTTDRIRLDSGGTNYVDIENSNSEITINEDSSQIDFRVESDNQDHMLFVDGSADAIGIGESNPVNPIHVGITTPFDLSYANTGQDAIYLIGGGDNSGLNAIGSSIGFGPPSSTRGEQRKAAIASIQTSGDVDHLGLAFFVHGNDINQTDMTEGMRLTHDKNLGINNTSPDANLDVVGTMQFVDGNESTGYVLTSDATGNATWTDPNTLITTSSDWTTTGNTGTNPTTNFIGTTDAQDFSIRTNNTEKVRITTKGQIETTQLQSVWIGENTGNAVTTGSSNTAVGTDAFTLNTTGNNNIAIGYNSLNANTSGDNNVGIGYQALASNTTQNNNNALGYRALASNTVGFGNSAFGYLALESNTTADRNIAFGNQALRTQTSDGFDNVALGYFTLTNNTSGDYNVAVGSQALLANTASNYNVAVGSNALASTTVNGQNVAVGHEVLTTNTAPFNTGVGYRALATNTTGQYNVGIGHSALDVNTTGSGNTALGYNAASNSNNTGTTAIGYNALAIGTGTQNVSIGYQAMQNSTTAVQNTVVGFQAMSGATSTGGRNTAIGRTSMFSNTSGLDNTAVGGLSLYSNTTGTDNTALGLAALYDLTIGNGNTVVGEQAAENLVSGNYNVVLGHQAGENMTGSSNVFIGYSAGQNSTASNRLYIENSNSSQPLIFGTFDTNEVGINWPSATALPNTLSVNGNASKSVAGGWLANSDRRLKKDINQISGKTALEKIQNMRGVTYLWNDDKTGIERPDNLQYGFIAQEIMEVFPEKVTEDNLGYYQTAYGDYDPIFVEAIKELKNEVETLKEENIKLKEALKKQEQLEQRLEALERNLN